MIVRLQLISMKLYWNDCLQMLKELVVQWAHQELLAPWDLKDQKETLGQQRGKKESQVWDYVTNK